MTVASATVLEGILVEPGSFDFAIDALTTLFVNVLARASGSGSLVFGQYGVEIVALSSSDAARAVPVPAAAILLAPALVGLALVARRRV